MKSKLIALVSLMFLTVSAASLQARACDDDMDAAQDSKTPSLTLTASGPETAVFKVSGILCKSCEKHIQAALRKVSGVKSVAFKKTEGKSGLRLAEVTFEKGAKVTPASLVQAVEAAGYKATATQ